ncbi:MAG TPA: polyprenol monophosphomannose synthase [Ilumatobacteraceae bacterium]|nr:polyprenol monophosphomannose synthase [Ilumatobacteraceae bacterium]
MRVAVVVPTYNEAGTIVEVCERIRVALPDADIVVVDDGSPDGTASLVRATGDRMGRISVVERDGKNGLGAAYRAGFAQAIDGGAEICVQLDADLSHDPAVLPALVSNIEHGADLAIGSRYVPGGVTEDWPWRRRALSRWGNRYAAGVLGLAVNDATAGLRAYSVDALRRMDFATVSTEGYGFQVEMTHRLVRAEGKIVEFPITFRERTVGESKLSNGIVNEAFVLVMRLWLQDMRGRRQRRRHSG